MLLLVSSLTRKATKTHMGLMLGDLKKLSRIDVNEALFENNTRKPASILLKKEKMSRKNSDLPFVSLGCIRWEREREIAMRYSKGDENYNFRHIA